MTCGRLFAALLTISAVVFVAESEIGAGVQGSFASIVI